MFVITGSRGKVGGDIGGVQRGMHEFEAGEGSTRKGAITLDSAIRSMISDRQG